MGITEGVFIRSGLLFTDEEWKQLPIFIKEKEIGLVVIDPLVFATGGGDENDAGKMSRFFLKLREIIFTTGATIVVVHHHRKSPSEQAGDQIRGSSAILGAVDVALELVRENDKTPTATLKVTSRLGMVEDQIIRLDVDTLTWESAGRAEDWKKAKRENEILEVLESEGECSINDLEQYLGVTPQNFRRDLKALVTKGLVEERKVPSRGRPKLLYRLLDFSPTPPFEKDFSPTPSANNKSHSNGENGLFADSQKVGLLENGEKSETPEKTKKLTMDEMIEETKRQFPGSEIVPEGEVPF